MYEQIENGGIAANTNAARSLRWRTASTDHDDVLAPHAMYTMGNAVFEVRAARQNTGADFVYSDEVLFSEI